MPEWPTNWELAGRPMIGTAYAQTGLKPRKGVEAERVGLPLRAEIAAIAHGMEHDRIATRQSAAAQLGVDPNRPLVVVTGGSLGAVNVNRAVAASARELLEHAQVIHLTGKGKDDEVRSLVSVSAGEQVLGELGPDHGNDGDYRVAPYLERIDLAFACADLIICRSGAGTVSELTALGTPRDLCSAANRQRRAAIQRPACRRCGRRSDGG